MQNKLIIIIPAYNESGVIKEVINSVLDLDKGFDAVVVNDASTDNTAKIIEGVKKVTLLSLPVNLGIGGAMQTGYRYAAENNYDFAVQVDGDGQHLPSEIEKLLSAKEKTGANLVIGSRFIKRTEYKQGIMRRLGINFLAVATRLFAGKTIWDSTSGFRLADKKVISMFAKDYPSDYPEPEVLVRLNKRGLKFVETPVKMKNRNTGKSSITPIKSVYYMFKVVFAMAISAMRSENETD